MSEKGFNLRAGYYYEYTGICSNTDENLTTNEVVNLLNNQDKTIKELNKYCTACDDTLMAIQELTYKLLTIDFENAESKADYCILLNELDNKDLSFIHDCIKAINKCDIIEMDNLKKEYYDGMIKNE